MNEWMNEWMNEFVTLSGKQWLDGSNGVWAHPRANEEYKLEYCDIMHWWDTANETFIRENIDVVPFLYFSAIKCLYDLWPLRDPVQVAGSSCCHRGYPSSTMTSYVGGGTQIS